MRELELNEMEVIAGGNPLLIGAIAGAVVMGGMVVVAVVALPLIGYGISQGCSGNVKLGPSGVEASVTCPTGP